MMGREKAVALLLCGVRLEEEAKASPPPLCPTACLGHGEQLLGAPFLRWQLGVGTGTTAAAFDHLSPRGGDMLSSQDRCEGQECGPKGRVACAPAQAPAMVGPRLFRSACKSVETPDEVVRVARGS